MPVQGSNEMWPPDRVLAEYRIWDVVYPLEREVLRQLGDEVDHREELEALSEVRLRPADASLTRRRMARTYESRGAQI